LWATQRGFWRPLAVLFLTTQFGRAGVVHSSTYFVSDQKKIQIDECSSDAQPSAMLPAILVLSGSGGLASRGLPYRSKTIELAERGYRVYLPHYTDATRGSVSQPDSKYSIWVRVVREAITSILAKAEIRQVVLIGYSLGASVALAEASRDPRVRGVVSWSGSLPDEYARAATALPPLLIIHGEKDAVIPMSDAVQLTKLCHLLRTRCEFRTFPGESHWFSPGGIVAADQFIWRFLESLSAL
jgi:carboxymethylenebutenolidase